MLKVGRKRWISGGRVGKRVNEVNGLCGGVHYKGGELVAGDGNCEGDFEDWEERLEPWMKGKKSMR